MHLLPNQSELRSFLNTKEQRIRPEAAFIATTTEVLAKSSVNTEKISAELKKSHSFKV